MNLNLSPLSFVRLKMLTSLARHGFKGGRGAMGVLQAPSVIDATNKIKLFYRLCYLFFKI